MELEDQGIIDAPDIGEAHGKNGRSLEELAIALGLDPIKVIKSKRPIDELGNTYDGDPEPYFIYRRMLVTREHVGISYRDGGNVEDFVKVLEKTGWNPIKLAGNNQKEIEKAAKMLEKMGIQALNELGEPINKVKAPERTPGEKNNSPEEKQSPGQNFPRGTIVPVDKEPNTLSATRPRLTDRGGR